VTGVQTCALPISPKPQNPKTPVEVSRYYNIKMYTDKSHIIQLVNELAISILALAFLVVSLTVYNKMSTDVGAFNQVSDDWKLPSIVDLQVVHFS
jgi:hypothetical protein